MVIEFDERNFRVTAKSIWTMDSYVRNDFETWKDFYEHMIEVANKTCLNDDIIIGDGFIFYSYTSFDKSKRIVCSAISCYVVDEFLDSLKNMIGMEY